MMWFRASEWVNTLRYWESGAPRESRTLFAPSLPPYPSLFISSIWLFLTCIRFNQPVTESKVFSWFLWVVLLELFGVSWYAWVPSPQPSTQGPPRTNVTLALFLLIGCSNSRFFSCTKLWHLLLNLRKSPCPSPVSGLGNYPKAQSSTPYTLLFSEELRPA